MEQNYPVVLRKLSPEDGGGWLAEIPELPGCMSDGETPQEALANIEDAKRAWIEVAIQRGQQVPLPESDSDDDYSGKFTLRLPKFLHRQLVKAAKKEGVSLNQYVIALLSFNFGKISACRNEDCRKTKNITIHFLSTRYDTDVYQQRRLTERFWEPSNKSCSNTLWRKEDMLRNIKFIFGGNVNE
ncbi:toxin-antitoxin system HicB family antitoxin [Desulfofundulus thermobenzoicus]|uniref:Toxin-antitoxin system HicB family antitoxin n=2 Tax=Desulfofundulus thermobenzoicus TaxID=29376 RepID=A0A6N7IUC2_9FIRM|nr:toxin-antitoxin system HicB family antitoxin [Desulfofundulus thermobenzoicus]